jgi:hypothetical protein
MNQKTFPFIVIFFLLLSQLLYPAIAQAKDWSISENEMKKLIAEFSSFTPGELKKDTCWEKININRYKNETGVVFEKTSKCSCSVSNSPTEITEILKRNIKSLDEPMQNRYGLLMQRGLFFHYIYKDCSGKAVSEVKIDREALFGKPFSKLLESKNGNHLINILINNSTLSFIAHGLKISKVPGLPSEYSYEGNERTLVESYFFNKNKIDLSISALSTSQRTLDKEQLERLNDFDFETKKDMALGRGTKLIKAERVKGKYSDLFNAEYKLIFTSSGKKEKQMMYAYSALIDERHAVFLYFDGPFSANIKKLAESILSSVKLN